MLKHKDEGHGPRSLLDSEDSAVLVDATLKETYPPVSLPKREYMEKAADIWYELGLPKLRPQAPWYGYVVTPEEWSEEFEEEAELAVAGRYYELPDAGYTQLVTGAKIGIMAAGTSDIGVAEEARLVAKAMGCEATASYDVGIAGIHRLLAGVGCYRLPR